MLDLSKKPLIPMDTGIASQENLDCLKEQGYEYIAVSRKQIQTRFLEELDCLKAGLTIKRRTKNYTKIIEKIGSLKERYSATCSVLHFGVGIAFCLSSKTDTR